MLMVSLLGVSLSIPSTVFAQASWYGSIRTGISSVPDKNEFSIPIPAKTGVADFASRWGIQGSNEVSEGLTAVYRYERSIDSTNAGDPNDDDGNDTGGRLSYVGLSGGFGTITIGKIWGAAYNHFGAIVDQALNYGSPGETGLRFENAVSYAVSVGNVSLQVDAIMDKSTGKSVDAFNFGATLGGVMETGSVAIAYRKHPDADSESDHRVDDNFMTEMTSSFIAGSYGIGDMTVFLGYSQDSFEDPGCTDQNTGSHFVGCYRTTKTKTTFAGVHGGVGDTGVNYVFTMKDEKLSGSGYVSGNLIPRSAKSTPWTLGLSRNLGGGAALNFEHGEPDREDIDSSTGIWLQVDF